MDVTGQYIDPGADDMSRLLLPCHPPRRDGEILSTWRLRIASANVNSVRELCKWLGSDAVFAPDLMGYNNPLVGSHYSEYELTR
jgi:hypothetical protein